LLIDQIDNFFLIIAVPQKFLITGAAGIENFSTSVNEGFNYWIRLALILRLNVVDYPVVVDIGIVTSDHQASGEADAKPIFIVDQTAKTVKADLALYLAAFGSVKGHPDHQIVSKVFEFVFDSCRYK
jgi:hypothetical protein